MVGRRRLPHAIAPIPLLLHHARRRDRNAPFPQYSITPTLQSSSPSPVSLHVGGLSRLILTRQEGLDGLPGRAACTAKDDIDARRRQDLEGLWTAIARENHTGAMAEDVLSGLYPGALRQDPGSGCSRWPRIPWPPSLRTRNCDALPKRGSTWASKVASLCRDGDSDDSFTSTMICWTLFPSGSRCS